MVAINARRVQPLLEDRPPYGHVQLDEDVSNKTRGFYVNILKAIITFEGKKGILTVTSMPQTSETGLVARAQNGDRNAFGELVRIHANGVMAVVYRMCGNVQLAEDAAQETFIQAWVKLESFHPNYPFRNWLYRIAVNTAVDMLRKEKRILPDSADELNMTDDGPGPETVIVRNEQERLVQKAISSLPDASRAVLILREFEGLSYKEIADALDIPVGTVMSRLNYARKLLREKLLEVHLFSFAEVENV
jgi:RNA polymerase sigma-70 factor (ECF subfamily)